MKKADGGRSPQSRFAYGGLDRVIHERARLSVLTSLVSHPSGLSFGELKALCGLTDGNLNRHLRVLEQEKMVASSRHIEQQRPLTRCRITALGRRRYIEYLAVLEQVLRDANRAVEERRVLGSRPMRPALRSE